MNRQIGRQPSAQEAARIILAHLRGNAGRESVWKELGNITGARPERVKDAIAHLTNVEHAPIRVRGSGCTYLAPVKRTPTPRREEAMAATNVIGVGTSAVCRPMALDTELAALRDSLLEMATRVEDLQKAVGEGKAVLPRVRDAETEGAALRMLREERGVDRATLAKWLGKSEKYVDELEDGVRAMTEAEAREFVKELRMDGGVFNTRLGQGTPVFAWQA